MDVAELRSRRAGAPLSYDPACSRSLRGATSRRSRGVMTLTRVGYARRAEDFVPAWSRPSGAERAVDSPNMIPRARSRSRAASISLNSRVALECCRAPLEVRREKLGIFEREGFAASHGSVAQAHE